MDDECDTYGGVEICIRFIRSSYRLFDIRNEFSPSIKNR
jgi:hypothetical protein